MLKKKLRQKNISKRGNEKRQQVTSSFKHKRMATSKRIVQKKLKQNGQKREGQKRRVEGRRKERRKWWRVVLIAVSVVGSGLFLNLLLRFLFTAQKVECTMNQAQVCPSLLLTKLEEVRGRALFFTNYQDLIAGLRSSNVDFDDFSYQKVLPDTLRLHFSFAAPVYQVVSAGQNYYLTQRGGFTQEGTAGLLVVNDRTGKLGAELANYHLDDFFQQKMLELNYYWRESGLALGEVDYDDVGQVMVRVGEQAYVIDLTNLDENWQKVVFIEENDWPTERKAMKGKVIDVRFRLPVVREEAAIKVATT
jgi:hypothetical protein